MPESKKERISILTGKITETTSSDSYVENSLESLRKEVSGLTDQVVDVASEDVLTPQSTTSGLNHSDNDQLPVDSTRSFTAKDSRTAGEIFRKRQRLLRKAA